MHNLICYLKGESACLYVYLKWKIDMKLLRLDKPSNLGHWVCMVLFLWKAIARLSNGSEYLGDFCFPALKLLRTISYGQFLSGRLFFSSAGQLTILMSIRPKPSVFRRIKIAKKELSHTGGFTIHFYVFTLIYLNS
jgi:hypothetical protein